VTITDRQIQFGNTILGPIFYQYCCNLWLSISVIDDKNACLLFLARGGLRLKYLFQRFLVNQKLEVSNPLHDFLVSRISVIRAVFLHNPHIVLKYMDYELGHMRLIDLILLLLLPEPAVDNRRMFENDYGMDFLKRKCSYSNIAKLLQAGHSSTQILVDFLSEQGRLFRNYLDRITGGSHKIIVCDTGLYGSSQAMLQDAFPQREWRGLYFAKSNYKRIKDEHANNVLGLILDFDYFSPFKPETCILKHWHLIEAAMEIQTPSVTHYIESDSCGVMTNLPRNWEAHVAARDNPLFCGIMDYFTARANAKADFMEIKQEYIKAMRTLGRMIAFPSRDDVTILNVPARSKDMGSDREFKQVLYTERGNSTAGNYAILKRSLWKEGQIKILYPFAANLLNFMLFLLYASRAVVRYMKTIINRLP
jgi:hypothetical protein